MYNDKMTTLHIYIFSMLQIRIVSINMLRSQSHSNDILAIGKMRQLDIHFQRKI